MKENSGDTVPVPRLVFGRLADYDADEARFRVALYLLDKGEADVAGVAKALGIETERAGKALAFWEGAGLVSRLEAATAIPVVSPETKRHRLNSREVAQAGAADSTLGMLTQELQRVFGGVVSEGDTCVFATLYLQDGFEAELILTAASYCVTRGKISARYIEKVLLSWRREGINDCKAADRYLQQLALREQREKEVAEQMGLNETGFSLAERRRIAEWYEEYGYGPEMIEMARLAAGDKKNEVRYLAAILKKWHAKGYKTARDVQQGEDNRNLRVEGSRGMAPGGDILSRQDGYVPMKKRRNKA